MISMKISKYLLDKNFFNTLSNIVYLSLKYYRDIKHFNFNGIKDLFIYLQSRYGREKGEILHRPIYYKIFKNRKFDCDDFTIFIISYLIYKGFNVSDIYLVLSGNNKISHIYPMIKLNNVLVKIDPLPINDFYKKKIYPIEIFYKFTDFLIDKNK